MSTSRGIILRHVIHKYNFTRVHLIIINIFKNLISIMKGNSKGYNTDIILTSEIPKKKES